MFFKYCIPLECIFRVKNCEDRLTYRLLIFQRKILVNVVFYLNVVTVVFLVKSIEIFKFGPDFILVFKIQIFVNFEKIEVFCLLQEIPHEAVIPVLLELKFIDNLCEFGNLLICFSREHFDCMHLVDKF